MATKKILISQETPMNVAPYETLKEKFGVQICFRTPVSDEEEMSLYRYFKSVEQI